MTRNSVYFGVLEKPTKPRPSHEQLASELHQWLAHGGRIKTLPSGKTGQDKGNAK
jgi:hypothetical protein